MALKVRLVFLCLCSFGPLAEHRSSAEPYRYRLVRGAGRCQGELELQGTGQIWLGVSPLYFSVKSANRVCAELDCGSVLSMDVNMVSKRTLARVSSNCEDTSLKNCFKMISSSFCLELNCSDSVRLLPGPSLCSGLLQVHWNQPWTSVCEGDLGLQGLMMVCKELGCGAPSLQGPLYREGQAPLGLTVHCKGNESALVDCPRSSSQTCSSGPAVNLTCSEPVRLVGGASRCAGVVEVRHRGEWRRVRAIGPVDLETTAAVCRDLDCGSTVSVEVLPSPETLVWSVRAACVRTAALRDCVWGGHSIYSESNSLKVVCSDVLNRPVISVVVSGASEARPQGVQVLMGSDFSIMCSVEPQYPGGSFQLLSPTVNATQNLTLPAVNHSALFLFYDAGPAHGGIYTCVYHQQAFNHSFSSQSGTLQLSLGISGSQLLIRALTLLLLKLMYLSALYYYYCEATRGHHRGE